MRKALGGEYALIILDLMLPGMDGLSVCRRIREGNSITPILMLTAKSEEADRVHGLELGADDYLGKPFSVRELVARVKALLRRAKAGREAAGGRRVQGRIELGGLALDFDKRKVTLEGRIVELTVKEFDLLALFALNPGRTYGRTELLNLVWGEQFEGYEHTVNSHINRLRGKIERDPARPRYLKTVWGVGYRFSDAAELSP
jgi:DNA-binding response OmpR family regulator